MGNYNLQRKGDSITLRKKGKCVTFWVTDEHKAEFSAYADEYNATVSRLVVEGLEMRLNQG